MSSLWWPIIVGGSAALLCFGIGLVEFRRTRRQDRAADRAAREREAAQYEREYGAMMDRELDR